MAGSLAVQMPSDLDRNNCPQSPNKVVYYNNASTSTSASTNTSATTNNNPFSNGIQNMSGYTLREQPLGWARPVRIITIGAGASGLNLIRTLRLQLTNFEHVVYEKNPDVGGTWFENRYPGCRCDIPSHNYQFSWRPKKDWTNFFGGSEEIEQYLTELCDAENMRDVIRTRHQIVSAVWDEPAGHWLVKVKNLATNEVFEDKADFLINAAGILNNWKWPDIEGLHDFKGDLIHSANWPDKFDWKDKNVAVIGNGSSGIQIVPELQPQAKKLVHIVRTPTWVIPPRVQIFAMTEAASMIKQIEMDKDENFSAAQIERFKSDPIFYRDFVRTIEKEVNNTYRVLIKDSIIQQVSVQKVKQYMTFMLGGDERLCKELIPDYGLGCRRMTPGPGYLPALTQPNVDVVTEGVRRITSNGIEFESGKFAELDAIVCATGFDLSFRPRFPLTGRTGDLQELWNNAVPKAYMSCAVAGMPNYFTFLGPNAPIGHGSVFTLSEHIATYIARVIKKCQTEGIKALAPSQAAVDDFNEHARAVMPRTTWSSTCRSWFKHGDDPNGPVTAVHPGSRIHFFHMLENFRGEDFEYVYAKDGGSVGDDGTGDVTNHNRFRYLGQGFSVKELDEEHYDPVWYLETPELNPELKK